MVIIKLKFKGQDLKNIILFIYAQSCAAVLTGPNRFNIIEGQVLDINEYNRCMELIFLQEGCAHCAAKKPRHAIFRAMAYSHN